VLSPVSLGEKPLWKGRTYVWPGRAKVGEWLAALLRLLEVVPEFQYHHSQFFTRSPTLLCAGEVQRREMVLYLQLII